jgi:hypothetical protein
MHPVELETLVDRALTQLPQPRAPHTLLPRVLAAVQAWAERPWYRRAWLTWPAGWQTVSVTAFGMLIVTAALALPLAQAAMSEWLAGLMATRFGQVAVVAMRIGHTVQSAEATTSAAWSVWRVLVLPWVAYASGLLVLMCAACAVFASALNTLAQGKAVPR